MNYFFLIPLVFLINFLIRGKKAYLFIFIICLAIFLIEFIPQKTLKDPFYFFSLFLSLFSFPYLVNQYKKMTATYTSEVDKELNRLFADCKELEIKIADVDKEIKKLEKENTTIFDLYEITKDMSRILSLRDMFKFLQGILQKKFFFERGYLVTMRFELPTFHVDKIYDLSTLLENNFKEVYLPKKEYYKVIEKLFYEGGSFYFDDKNKEISDKFGIEIVQPFAVSTLKLGNMVIGFLILEGFKKEEFSKFSVFSTQLSMELKRVILYENMEKMATTDSLTGLYVRRKIIESLEFEIERAKKYNFPITFLMLDIDHFKRCNDYFGHLTGDYVLREISRILKTNLREIDLVGRYGGEEIAILLLNTKEDEAKIVAERLREVIANFPFKAYGEKFKITVSIGGSVFPQDGNSVLQLIKEADEALYSAKRLGRNCVVFYKDIK